MLNQSEAIKIYDNVMNTQYFIILVVILFLLFVAAKMINIHLNKKRIFELKRYREELCVKKLRRARQKRKQNYENT